MNEFLNELKTKAKLFRILADINFFLLIFVGLIGIIFIAANKSVPNDMYSALIVSFIAFWINKKEEEKTVTAYFKYLKENSEKKDE